MDDALVVNGNPLIGYMNREDWPDGRVAYDPGLEAACPVCHAPLTLSGNYETEKKKILAITLIKGNDRAYFYRVHLACHAHDMVNDCVVQDKIVDDIEKEEAKRDKKSGG